MGRADARLGCCLSWTSAELSSGPRARRQSKKKWRGKWGVHEEEGGQLASVGAGGGRRAACDLGCTGRKEGSLQAWVRGEEGGQIASVCAGGGSRAACKRGCGGRKQGSWQACVRAAEAGELASVRAGGGSRGACKR
eukprot:363887-Chlamydomonas_euryale.AAC.1